MITLRFIINFYHQNRYHLLVIIHKSIAKQVLEITSNKYLSQLRLSIESPSPVSLPAASALAHGFIVCKRLQISRAHIILYRTNQVIIMDFHMHTQPHQISTEQLKEKPHYPSHHLLDDPVQLFLDLKPLCIPNISLPQTQEEKDKNEAIPHEKETSSLPPLAQQLNVKKKSIFHNFQKHLITLLKKEVRIHESTLPEHASAELCRILWESFIKTHSFNKHVLHMIFGIATNGDIDQQLIKIAEKYPSFRQICQHYDSKQITVAQSILRDQARRQMEKLGKQELRHSCCVQKLEIFYEYLRSFMEQIKEGPITSRMLKSRKSQVITKLCVAAQNE